MGKAIDFFVWVILGGVFILFAVVYDMWLSRTGRDILSECKKILRDAK